MVVEELMTENPIAATPEWTLQQALDTFHDNDIRHLPVVHNGALVGMVSDRDLRREMMPTMAAFEDPTAAKARYGEALADIMRGDVLSVDSETDVTEAVDLMLEHKVGALPVVRPGERVLVGIISSIDVLRAARDLF